MRHVPDQDICWFCEVEWSLEDAEYHHTCDTWRCPACGKCFCDLPEFTRQVLDREFYSIGLWNPFKNLPCRKRRTPYSVEELVEDFKSLTSEERKKVADYLGISPDPASFERYAKEPMHISHAAYALAKYGR